MVIPVGPGGQTTVVFHQSPAGKAKVLMSVHDRHLRGVQPGTGLAQQATEQCGALGRVAATNEAFDRTAHRSQQRRIGTKINLRADRLRKPVQRS
jgi:hypothetical protein